MEHWHRLPIEAVEILLGDQKDMPGHDLGHPAMGVPDRAGVGQVDQRALPSCDPVLLLSAQSTLLSINHT